MTARARLLQGLLLLAAGCGGPGGVSDQQGELAAAAGQVDSNGGSLIVTRGPLAGTRADIPTGATGAVNYLILNPVDPIAAPGFVQVGPAIHFAPTGEGYGVACTLTVPYDPSLIPAGRSPSDICILYADPLHMSSSPLVAQRPGVFSMTAVPTFVQPISLSTTARTVSTVTYQDMIFEAVIPPNPPAAVTNVSPHLSPLGGGAVLTITGRNFQPGAIALQDGVPMRAVQVLSSTTLTAVTVPHGCGTVFPADVAVRNPDGGRGVQFGELFFARPGGVDPSQFSGFPPPY